jgi:hypothetical protein
VRRRRLAASAIVTALLVALPVVGMQVTGPGDSRFSWAMFHGGARDHRYELDTGDGWQTVEVADHVAWPVRHVPYGRAVPDRLCATSDDVVAVRRTTRQDTEVVACDR